MQSFVRAALVLVPLVLTGCKPADVALALDPGFFPSAVAYDPISDRFFIGSHATGTVAIVRRDGRVAAVVRPERAPYPVVQLGYEPRVQRLWVLTSEAIEAVDTGALPVRRTVVVLLGRLRHHPSLGGDGRPNLPPRLASYFASGVSVPRLAAATPAAEPALVR